MMWSSRGPGRKYIQTLTESLIEVQCIVMKIKDTLITAAKWYWTSVNAGEGTSKNEDSWTSHKMPSLSACAWGCKWSTRAPDSQTRNGPTLPWTRWLHRENGTNPSHIRPTSPLSPAALLYPGEHCGISIRAWAVFKFSPFPLSVVETWCPPLLLPHSWKIVQPGDQLHFCIWHCM